MKLLTAFATSCVLLGAAHAVDASDHTGAYAVIHKVEVRNSGTDEETIVLFGVFSTSMGRREYNAPLHGYMYYKLHKGAEEACRKEWADFKRVAGTGQCIAFGSRSQPLGRVRSVDQLPYSPDKYPVNVGLRLMRFSSYTPLEELAYYPRPVDLGAIPPGELRLTVHNIPGDNKSVRYYFELQDSRGKTERSGPVAAGEKLTAWTPQMQTQPGGRYTWRAWVVWKGERQGRKTDGWKGPVATSRFRGERG